MLKTFLAACCVFCGVVALVSGVAFATGQGGVTWGTNTYAQADGGVCIQTVQDGGITDTDGGVCADGGTLCQSCGGSCNIDAGWNSGASIAATASDPVATETSYKATCFCNSTTASGVNNVSMQLQGSTDLTNPGIWTPYPNTSLYFTPDGGNTQVGGWIQYAGAVATYSRVQITSVFADGGGPASNGPLCCCTYEAH